MVYTSFEKDLIAADLFSMYTIKLDMTFPVTLPKDILTVPTT